jgi:type IV secretion system protein VirD4
VNDPDQTSRRPGSDRRCDHRLGVWFATEWCAAQFAFQPRLGAAWFEVIGFPVYYPRQLFEWWCWYDAYAPELSNDPGIMAASSGLLS